MSTSKKGVCGIRCVLERLGKSTSLILLKSLLNSCYIRSTGVMPLNYLEDINLFHKSNIEKSVANIRRLFTNLHEVNKFGINTLPTGSIFILF